MVAEELIMDKINSAMDLNNLLFLNKVGSKYNESLVKIATGQKINSAADDASGLMIADQLRSYAESMSQSMANANDSIGIAKIADGAMSQQSEILDQMRTKAVAANSAINNSSNLSSIKGELQALSASYDSISANTSYNGKSLLSGFSGSFEVSGGNGMSSLNISDTSLSKVTGTTYTTGAITGLAADGSDSVAMQFTSGGVSTTLSEVQMGTAVGQGVGALASEINKYSDTTGVKAHYSNTTTGSSEIAEGLLNDVRINGVDLGSIEVDANDATNSLVTAINSQTLETGVEAYLNEDGKLTLNSLDGRGMQVEGLATAGIADDTYNGSLTLTNTNGAPVAVEDTNGTINFSSDTVTLEESINNMDSQESVGVVQDLLDGASASLSSNRANVGSFQNSMESQVSNLASSYVNTKYSESQMRDTDMVQEIMNMIKQQGLTEADIINQQYINKYRAGIMALLN
jgi:flagellin